MLAVVLGVTLGLGLGVGLTGHHLLVSPRESTIAVSFPIVRNANSTNATTAATWWTPKPGLTWQIEILHPLNDTTANVTVYDIDLFTNDAATIAQLHATNRKVICYFSAGSYEDFRPDSADFTPSDYGSPLVGWPGEWWLNTNSTNVRKIMVKRLDIAASNNCDGVDPDNIDGFKNPSGFNLTRADAIDYITFLSDAAHARNLSMGLKNGGDIVKKVVDKVEYAVNEQCVKYRECNLYQPLIATDKPVFHIEYPNKNATINATLSAEAVASICNHRQAAKFSTILKHMRLDDWMVAC
ncbi:hypothetical protein EG329_009350 [Mollisiaceae sp. DMI_Dod_QoI]|nr:hypothetical protein EG329_009350 [Helotiales sp. DMI_Dod_QoI]